MSENIWNLSDTVSLLTFRKKKAGGEFEIFSYEKVNILLSCFFINLGCVFDWKIYVHWPYYSMS